MNAGLVLPAQALSGTSGSINSASSSNSGNVTGFGAVLTALSSAKVPADDQQHVLSADQAAILQELVQFLQIGDISEIDGGLQFGRDVLLEGKQTQSHPIVELLLKGGLIDEKLLEKLVEELKETGQFKDPDDELSEENIFFPIGAFNLLSIIKAIAGMNVEQLQKVDLGSASNITKYAKIQELLNAYQDMSSDKAAVNLELKDLLEKIVGKFQSLLENDTLRKSGGTSFTKIMGTDGSQNMEVLKGVYARLADDVNLTKTKSGLNLGNESVQGKQLDMNQSQPHHFQISKLEQFVLTIEKSGQPVKQEQFIKAFENILSKANFTNGNGMQKLFIKLNPEHLGSLRIEIIQKDSVLIAKIMATTANAKDLLESQIQGLKHAFNGQNLQIEKIEVSQAMNSFTQERFLQRESDGSPHHEKGKQEQDNQQDNPEAEFTADLEAALLNTKV